MAQNILERIIERKQQEVKTTQSLMPEYKLEKTTGFFSREVLSFSQNIVDINKSGIIAEHKRQSPSKGIINAQVTLPEVVIGYQKANASAISVLTDKDFFGGSNEDLIKARALVQIPILRKDFIISEYQILEAKAIGADAILLIAAVLKPAKLNSLAAYAKELGMEVLMEVHNLEELERSLNDYIDVVGVNNRNLKDFSESIETSIQLAEAIPNKYVKISESSISKAETILTLKQYGYQGFLIGETFMKQTNPGLACSQLAEEIKFK
ncbi:MAG: indole-3-glycerol phosphate synthase TrpC [Cytophagales bacterium]|nr:MAG: indole-3-glycerol phosphate synthase TrpC [Cytophagales bacterium]